MPRNFNSLNGIVFGFSLLIGFFVFAFSVSAQTPATPSQGAYYGGSVVGGVEINADGNLKTVPTKKMEEVAKNLKKYLEPIPTDLNENVPIRKISLKKLDASIRETIENKKGFSDAIRYLGGLTSIRYVVVNPEENDILLVGTSEAWQADSYGNIVGKTSGRPVYRLEDLLTVYRAWNRLERPTVITCSIDPTQEALVRIAQVEKQFFGVTAKNANAYAAAQETAYGLNTVTVQGIPEQSRFAMILAIADYKMKQIGLGHEKAPVRGLPSYTSLITGSRKQIHPRFWLAPEYGTVSHDSQKLTWQLSEVKVKALTDDEYIDSRSHSQQSSGKPDRAAIQWCGRMNNSYEALSKADPVFGDLKNCMEIAITVALIHRERLLEKANCKLTSFDDEKLLEPISYPVPKSVPSRAIISQNGQTTVVACGGVEVNPFITLQNAQLNSKMDAERDKLVKTTGDAWWSK
jgi:hypothetical protein